ncbi:glycine decarboxylase subunit T [Kluyveromyces lactis]|uniref:Aminomethyltransferase n=1 Tax=Kluyveromyces lactis (strain ATCC 8585 / CBS 2359 / DSM 70799 / NBRC 1267 / NRRL Y-1140 / WM37) TaxID=284590 RepID=Q6CW56_KLULA|nr:uncharacterized protein KLLA0_B06754g [Kluyveromyces lactis]CAH02226.1 KLLA0B06754p [Kluyveromyces lactis]|eukprot:XP_451833.1 uncharacterized protein KLLA0_B06754g [Kluyveromyces lactis]
MLQFRRFNSSSPGSAALKKTALYDLHVSLGGTMVPFAGYSMPVLYKGATHIESHQWTREHAGLFDVSHMLQSTLKGPKSIEFLHKVTPTDFKALEPKNGTLSVLLNENGGIVDDTLITKINDEEFYIVTNAGCIERDTEFLKDELSKISEGVSWETLKDRSLLALQGPQARYALAKLVKHGDLKTLYFGQRDDFELTENISAQVARSGYTGEDGFEISVLNKDAALLAQLLLDQPEVKPIGLAARDSLRLEAGMCLYGHELSESITPVEAALNWVISKSRRDGSLGKFNGFDNIIAQIKDKSYDKVRVGFKYQGKGPAARQDTPILNDSDEQVGVVTSGSASPSLDGINIGQAYVKKGLHKKGTQLKVQVRKKTYPIEIVKMPLVPTHYYRPE